AEAAAAGPEGITEKKEEGEAAATAAPAGKEKASKDKEKKKSIFGFRFWILDCPRVDETAIRLIAGLGNPGPEDAATRHNIGFMVVDQLVAQFGSAWEKSVPQAREDALSAKCGAVLLVKPLNFMNRSGYALFAVAQFYKIEPQQILVVLDDFSLPLGRLRLRARGGPGGHNGLESVIAQFGTEEIPRLRIGVGAARRGGTGD